MWYEGNVRISYPLFAFKTDYEEGDLILETSHSFNDSIHHGYHLQFNYTQTSSITQENHTKEFRFSDKGELLSYFYNKTTTFIDSEYSYYSETNITLEDIILKAEDTDLTGIYQLFYVQFAILFLIAEIMKIRKKKSNNSQTSWFVFQRKSRLLLHSIQGLKFLTYLLL